jgi:acetyl-CoA/propionyl-CoA carboxylase carboxyl transferase subunit
VLAWPGAEVAVMGAVAAVRILHRRRLAETADSTRTALETELAAEHEQLSGGLQRAIDLGVVDEVVEPQQTRSSLARALEGAGSVRRGRHGNIPL